jgi:ribosomal protein S6--L-glutamate ligase
MIVRGSRKLKELYHQLGSGDVFIGTIASNLLMQSVLIDFLERGVYCLPSPLSQCLSRSKAFQALVFKEWMLPHSRVIGRRVELMDAINFYNRIGAGAVITKENRRHCGHGVRRWETIETLYNMTAFSPSVYPFVLQPFQDDFTDIRVIVVEDYVEAYIRHNPHNFRMNISSGGNSHPCALDKKTEKLCRSIMDRGKFPFAHLDLQILDNEKCYLSEICLNGGIKGAKINRRQLDRKKQGALERMAQEIHPV